MTEIKPCPFCGNIAIIIEPYINSFGKQDGYEIECQNIYCCFQPSGWASTEDCAIKMWNERKGC